MMIRSRKRRMTSRTLPWINARDRSVPFPDWAWTASRWAAKNWPPVSVSPGRTLGKNSFKIWESGIRVEGMEKHADETHIVDI